VWFWLPKRSIDRSKSKEAERDKKKNEKAPLFLLLISFCTRVTIYQKR